MNSTKSIVVLLFAAMTSAVVTSNSHAQLFRNRGGGGTARNSIRRGPMMPPVPPMIRRVRSANGANTTNSSSGRQRIIRRDSAPASSNVTYQSTPTIVTTPTVRTAPATQPHQTYRVVSPSPTLAPAPPTAGTANSRAPSGQVEEARQLVKQARRYFELQRYQDAVSVLPAYIPSMIPGGVYEGIDYDVKTPAVSALLNVSSDLSEELVYGITAALWNKNTRKLLDNGHAKGKQITLESALDGIAALGVPLHPGAEKFYREVGALK